MKIVLFLLSIVLLSLSGPGCSKSEKIPGEQAVTHKADAPAAVSSGQESGISMSPGVTGAPKIVRMKLMPLSPKKEDELTVTAEAEPAGNVEFRYQWSVNGNTVSGATGPAFKGILKKGDKIMVMVTPESDRVAGEPLMQTAVVGNTPPVVYGNLADITVTETTYSGRVRAEDGDGDPIIYTLVKGPKGMILDKDSGSLIWNYRDAESGTHRATISVKDQDNAEATVIIPFDLQFNEKRDEAKKTGNL